MSTHDEDDRPSDNADKPVARSAISSAYDKIDRWTEVAMNKVMVPMLVLIMIPTCVILVVWASYNLFKNECLDSLPVSTACTHQKHTLTASSYGPFCVCRRDP